MGGQLSSISQCVGTTVLPSLAARAEVPDLAVLAAAQRKLEELRSVKEQKKTEAKIAKNARLLNRFVR